MLWSLSRCTYIASRHNIFETYWATRYHQPNWNLRLRGMQIFPPSTPFGVPAVMNRWPHLCKPVFWSELPIHRVDLGLTPIGLCFPRTCWLGARTILKFSLSETGRRVPLRGRHVWSRIVAYLLDKIFWRFTFSRFNN